MGGSANRIPPFLGYEVEHDAVVLEDETRLTGGGAPLDRRSFIQTGAEPPVGLLSEQDLDRLGRTLCGAGIQKQIIQDPHANRLANLKVVGRCG